MPYGFAEAVLRNAEPQVPPPASRAPPSWFRAAEGVRSAWPISIGPFGRTPTRGGTAAQRAGLAYEKKAQKHLSQLLGLEYKPGQWFKFQDRSGLRFCQVDGLLQAASATTVFEIKTTFTADAWWQLRKLYEPVVARAFICTPRLVVVCKNFDPAVAFPESVEHIELHRGLDTCAGKIGVFQWRP